MPAAGEADGAADVARADFDCAAGDAGGAALVALVAPGTDDGADAPPLPLHAVNRSSPPSAASVVRNNADIVPSLRQRSRSSRPANWRIRSAYRVKGPAWSTPDTDRRRPRAVDPRISGWVSSMDTDVL
jgi:hypothetical protein